MYYFVKRLEKNILFIKNKKDIEINNPEKEY